ncbi:MAG: alpha/beta hydrolase [Bryobacteraceae bacterium]
MRGLLLALVAGSVLAGELKTDIEFHRAGNVRLLMDAYIPEGSGPFPAVIWVHGGGFVAGDKQPHPKSLLEPLAAKGFAWFSVNYRLAPRFPFPAQTDDVESAIEYIRLNAERFKVNSKRLALMGASAGGHLVSYVGAKHRKENRVAAVVSFFGEHDLVGRVHPEGLCMIDGKVVPDPGPLCLSPGLSQFLGVTADSPRAEEVVKGASPATYVRKGMPPYLLIHGTKDLNVPYDQSELMCAAMRKAGASCQVVRVEGGGHGYGAWDRDPAMSGYLSTMTQWLDKVLR